MQTGWQSGILSCPCAFLPAGRHGGRQEGRREGKDASPTAGRRAGHSDCKGKGLSPRLYHSAGAWQHLAPMWQLVALFARLCRRFPCRFPRLHIFLIPTVPLRSCLYAPVPAGTRAGRDAGGRARMPARRQEGVPAIPTAKERDFRRTYVPLPLRGSIWRQCGSLWRSSAPFRPGFTPYLCTQAAGQCSRRVPQAPAPSFFWAAGGYRATDTQSSRE